MNKKIYKYLSSETKATKDKKRTFTFIASNEKLDRDQESIKVDGWKLTNYKKNPVVLWAHNYQELPIGKAKVYKKDNNLMADITFLDSDINPKADSIYKMIESGALNSCSVAFRPNWDKMEFGKDKKDPRVTYHDQELLEISIVPVPASPHANVQRAMDDTFKTAIEKEVVDQVEIDELINSISDIDTTTKTEPQISDLESFLIGYKEQNDEYKQICDDLRRNSSSNT